MGVWRVIGYKMCSIAMIPLPSCQGASVLTTAWCLTSLCKRKSNLTILRLKVSRVAKMTAQYMQSRDPSFTCLRAVPASGTRTFNI